MSTPAGLCRMLLVKEMFSTVISLQYAFLVSWWSSYQLVQFYSNNTINLCHWTPHTIPFYPQHADSIVAIDCCDVTSPSVCVHRATPSYTEKHGHAAAAVDELYWRRMDRLHFLSKVLNDAVISAVPITSQAATVHLTTATANANVQTCCCINDSKRLHRFCHLPNKVENIDCSPAIHCTYNTPGDA